MFPLLAKKYLTLWFRHYKIKMGHLTLEQRYKIETYHSLGKRIIEIADYIGKDKSVVSREIKRNSDGRNGIYKASLAHRKAQKRHQIKPKKLTFTPEVISNVKQYLAQYFSPEQMVGGFAYIEKNNEWVLESLTDKDHIRGAFKAYRKACFAEIGGLRPAMGWDTVDELLCRFYNWQIVTLEDLKVKHLKPTGAIYDQSARYKQGEAFYRLGYGFWITAIAGLKLALRKQKPLLFIDYLKGFFKAKNNKTPLLVTKEQAQFIRNYRWKKMKEKMFG
ncbi:helix-turn-helix domain-containing protein [Paenimyroides aestuarii]|uniref:Helix-turn-helix domain-containing protein n=1 Tax=Paenimyroides aestuarii TaxID=2968490 RepID=A0ABY5NP18_9FLAO|nr:helix-turn-helix domain-containing protein [Paenimyroides aestuarii]UUV20202.1 helix-turn-helix domain-containing protein [Paenimyroides aestuarii]